jgi:hypothetical protein
MQGTPAAKTQVRLTFSERALAQALRNELKAESKEDR